MKYFWFGITTTLISHVASAAHYWNDEDAEIKKRQSQCPTYARPNISTEELTDPNKVVMSIRLLGETVIECSEYVKQESDPEVIKQFVKERFEANQRVETPLFAWLNTLKNKDPKDTLDSVPVNILNKETLDHLEKHHKDDLYPILYPPFQKFLGKWNRQLNELSKGSHKG